MPDTQLLHIALQEGFFDDTVTILIDGKEVARRTNVTTKTQIGLAATVDLSLPPGPISLGISVRGRPPSEALPVELTGPTYVGVSIQTNGHIVSTRSDTPFRYA